MYRIALIVLYILPISTVWYFDYLPIQDYPRHLAGIKVLRGNNDLFLQDQFSISFFKGISPIPNIAFELFAGRLCTFCDINTAGRLFVSLYVILFVLSLYLLSRELKLVYSDLLFMALPLVYSTYFFMGFLNFIFSIPLFLMAIWAYLSAKREKRYLAILGVLLTLLYISHLFAFASFMLFLLIDLSLTFRKTDPRFIIWTFSSISVPLLFFINFVLRSSGNPVYYHPDGIWYKNIMLAFPFLYFSLKIGLVMFSGYVVALLFIFYGFAITNKVFVFAAASFLIVYFFLPFSSLEGTFVDARALPFGMLMLPLSVRLKRNLYKHCAFTLILLISILNSYVAWSSFSKFNSDITPEIDCLMQIKDKSRLLPISEGKKSPFGPYFLGEPYIHAWGYAFMDKDFMTPSFSSTLHHILRYKVKPYMPPIGWEFTENTGSGSFWDEIRMHYDYVAVFGTDDLYMSRFDKIGIKVCEGDSMKLYSVNKERYEVAHQ